MTLLKTLFKPLVKKETNFKKKIALRLRKKRGEIQIDVKDEENEAAKSGHPKRN
jgi:hypothetical protein